MIEKDVHDCLWFSYIGKDLEVVILRGSVERKALTNTTEVKALCPHMNAVHHNIHALHVSPKKSH